MTAWLVDEWQDWTGRRVVDNMTAVVQISAGRWRRTTIIGLPTKTAFCNNHIQCKQCKARHDTLRIVYRYSLDVVDSPWGFYGPAILILAGFGPVQSRLIILLTTQAWKQTLPPSDRTPYYIRQRVFVNILSCKICFNVLNMYLFYLFLIFTV